MTRRKNEPEAGAGYSLPSAEDFEQAILGTMISEPFHLSTINNILKKEYFFREVHQLVFESVVALYNQNLPIDMLTVTKELKRVGNLEMVGGAYFITSLTQKFVSATNIEYYCRTIHEKFILRELIVLGTQMIKQAYEPKADCFDIIEHYNKQISEVTSIIGSKTKRVGEIFGEVLKDIKDVQENSLPTGLLSGFENLDKVTGGWQPGTLNIMAARPGMGKTALALALAKHPAIELNKPVAIFSLEMTAKQLVGRLAASESDVSSSKINQKTVSHAELMQMSGRCMKMIDSPIYIDDTPNLKFSQLRTMAKKMVYDYKIEMIIIDYLQLMHGEERGNRENEIAYISRGLKALSKELNLPIIALSQLSREVEKRAGVDAKRPQLSDLRESGAIEQDADIVMFLFRPEYYGMFEEGYEYGAQNLNSKNLLLVDFAKGREIRICEVPLKFYGEFMSIENYPLRAEEKIIQETLSALDTNDDFLNNK